MSDEELIALALMARTIAQADNEYVDHYDLMRETCLMANGLDVEKIGTHMDRLAKTVRVDS